MPELWAKAHRDYLRGGLYDPQLRHESMCCIRPDAQTENSSQLEAGYREGHTAATTATHPALPGTQLPKGPDNFIPRSPLQERTLNIPRHNLTNGRPNLLPPPRGGNEDAVFF